MSEVKSDVVLSAMGQDLKGEWAQHFPKASERLEGLYSKMLISFTPATEENTIRAAVNSGWQVVVEETTINAGRLRAIERGLYQGDSFVNVWEADRLLHAAMVAPLELGHLARQIPNYDFLILGATNEGIKTHPLSMTVWEGVKSWWLGRYLGIEGDISNRGSFGFSREFATFVLSYGLDDKDETDGAFPVLALVYQQLLQANGQSGRGIGYFEYFKMASFENWMFEGSTPEESAKRHSSVQDYLKRHAHVERILQTADRIALLHGLTSPDETYASYRRFL